MEPHPSQKARRMGHPAPGKFKTYWVMLSVCARLRPIIAVLKVGPISRPKCCEKLHDKVVLPLLFQPYS